jgi:hypothetical protein
MNGLGCPHAPPINCFGERASISLDDGTGAQHVTNPVQVIIYPDGGQSLLLFSWDHMLFDYQTGFRFLQLWLSTAAAAAAGDAVAADAASGMLPTPCFSRACYQQCAVAVAAAPKLGTFPKECTCRTDKQQCQEQHVAEKQRTAEQQQLRLAWSIPVSPHDCLEWLRQQSKPGNSSNPPVSTFDQAVLVQQLRLRASIATGHNDSKHGNACNDSGMGFGQRTMTLGGHS